MGFPSPRGRKICCFSHKNTFKNYAFEKNILKKKGQKFANCSKIQISNQTEHSHGCEEIGPLWGNVILIMRHEAPKFMSGADSDKICTKGIRSGLFQWESVGVMLVFSCDLEASKGQVGQSRT